MPPRTPKASFVFCLYTFLYGTVLEPPPVPKTGYWHSFAHKSIAVGPIQIRCFDSSKAPATDHKRLPAYPFPFSRSPFVRLLQLFPVISLKGTVASTATVQCHTPQPHQARLWSMLWATTSDHLSCTGSPTVNPIFSILWLSMQPATPSIPSQVIRGERLLSLAGTMSRLPPFSGIVQAHGWSSVGRK